jgi:spore coat protein A
VWGFNGCYPGPTIEARSNEPVLVKWVNNLPAKHHLTVDHHLHGPDKYPGDPRPRAVVHLHGGHVPPESDGYPEATMVPGESAVYAYPNNQQAATLWYHDHALGVTRLNVYMGLAGLYLIRDDFEKQLDLPRGEYEIPLVIQDRSFRGDGSLSYPDVWEEEFFGDTILVNGRVWPYLDVKPRPYRFRIVNGSNSRTYILTLDPGQPFYQIGTDGGFLPEPVELKTIALVSGERVDVVIDFSKRRGEVSLVNSASAPFPGLTGQGVIREVMQFRVRGSAGNSSSLPATLRPLKKLGEESAITQRDLILNTTEDPRTGIKWLINGLGWDDITEFPKLETTEIWSFFNPSPDMHPIHLHLVQFQILDRQEIYMADGKPVAIGKPILPGPHELGWKDTVRADTGYVTRVIAQFKNYTGRYPYHCHILEHEDHKMMRQFEVVGVP